MDEFGDSISRKLQEYLGMAMRPVGVKLVKSGEKPDNTQFDGIEERQTFCRFVHEAAKDRNFRVEQDNLNCSNAEVVLGFRSPKIVKIEPRVQTRIEAVRVGPVENCDVVMLILNPEQIMTLANLIPNLNVSFRRNRTVCGEGVARVYNEQQPLVSFLCLGARTRGNFADHELLAALPYSLFLELPSRMGKFKVFSRQMKDSLKTTLLKLG